MLALSSLTFWPGDQAQAVIRRIRNNIEIQADRTRALFSLLLKTPKSARAMAPEAWQDITELLIGHSPSL
jgi:hypothetical protein